MPNRIIKESIRTSKSVNKMTDFQFRLWTYLITYVDDFGRGSADPEVLKGFIFPKRSVSDKTILKALNDLASIGSLILYEVDGDAFLCFPNWENHQTVRNKKSKFPAPPANSAIESNCMQEKANVSVIQSNPIRNPNPIRNTDSTEPAECSSVLTLPLNDGTEYGITQDDVDEYQTAYPAVDVMQQLRSMRQWCKDNPTKRKTKTGIRRFVNSWLDREQNRPHPGNRNNNTFIDMIREEVYGGG